MTAQMNATQIDADVAARIAKAAAKRARQAANKASNGRQPAQHVAVESDRPAAASVILPAAKLTVEHGPAIVRLRQAFTRFPLKYALKLQQIVTEDDTLEGLISEGIYYVERIEAKLAAQAEAARVEMCKANFPAHVRKLAGVFFPSRPQAQSMFVKRALEIGYGPNNAIETARAEAWAWLNPPPRKRGGVSAQV